MDETNHLWTAVQALARRNRLASLADLERASGVARTTLNRIRDGEGGRGDALAKLDEAFDIEIGTLNQVKRGELTPSDLLAGLDEPPDPPDPGLKFRVESLERAIALMAEKIDRIEEVLDRVVENGVSRDELGELRDELRGQR